MSGESSEAGPLNKPGNSLEFKKVVRDLVPGPGGRGASSPPEEAREKSAYPGAWRWCA